MKTLRWVVFGWLLTAAMLRAQTYNVIYTFTNYNAGGPVSGLILSGSTFFGVTYYGSSYRDFQVNADGTGYATFPNNGLSETAGPNLVSSGDILYGISAYPTAQIFQGFTDATNFTRNSSQVLPAPAWLVLSESTLYGAASGAIFKINPDGSGYALLHTFTNATDGSNPQGPLVLAGGVLYGTASAGGPVGGGTVFSLGTNGTGYTVLHTFTNTPDGSYPAASLVVNGSQLYGTTENGGSAGAGTIFTLGTNGTGYTILNNFTGTPDGANPQAALFQLGNTLYGTTRFGGSAGEGTLFQINLDGTGYALRHHFLGRPADGANPLGNLIMGSDGLYGTTEYGGATNENIGTIYRYTLPPPPLQVTSAGGVPVVFWPNDGFTHTLQTTTNLHTGPWITITNAPTLVGQPVTTVTNQPGAYFRLQ